MADRAAAAIAETRGRLQLLSATEADPRCGRPACQAELRTCRKNLTALRTGITGGSGGGRGAHIQRRGGCRPSECRRRLSWMNRSGGMGGTRKLRRLRWHRKLARPKRRSTEGRVRADVLFDELPGVVVQLGLLERADSRRDQCGEKEALRRNL